MSPAPFGSDVRRSPPRIELVALAGVQPSPVPRTQLGPTETVADGCARLATSLAPPAGTVSRCGAEAATPTPSAATSVRIWLVQEHPLLTNIDFRAPQIWLDEDVLPTHAHLVVELVASARTRYETFLKEHPQSRFATILDGVVEQIREAPLGEDGRLFITPSVPPGAKSNEPAVRALGAALGAAAP